MVIGFDKMESDFYDLFCELSGQEVADLFLNWHGTQLLTREFYVNTRDCEGYDLPLLEDEKGAENDV